LRSPSPNRRASTSAGGARPGGAAPLSDAEIDAQINDTLAAQLSGALDLSDDGLGLGGGSSSSPGRVDFSSSAGDVWEAQAAAQPAARAATTATASAAQVPLILDLDGSSSGAEGWSDPRTRSR
jgi:hypothetical protein